MKDETKIKRSRWTNEEIDAMLCGIEANQKHVLGAFSIEVTSLSKKQAWENITTMVSSCIRLNRLIPKILSVTRIMQT